MDEPNRSTCQRHRQLGALVGMAAVAWGNARMGVLQRARAAANSGPDGSPTAALAIDPRRAQWRDGMSAAERGAYRALRSAAFREQRSARLTAAASSDERRRAAEREAYRASRSAACRERRRARLTATASAAEQRRAAQVVQRQAVADAVMATTRELLCSEAAVPTPWTFEDAVREAGRFRECIDGLLPECLCAVCGRRSTRVASNAHSVDAIPSLRLLRADGPRDDEFPRSALTTLAVDGVAYCLTAAGVQDGIASICDECEGALRRGDVPPCSYVRVDEGPAPVDALGPLPELTALEERIVAPYRLHQYIVVCRPGARERSLVRAVRRSVRRPVTYV